LDERRGKLQTLLAYRCGGSEQPGGNLLPGPGGAKNNQEAVKWFRRAADQGYAEAQYNLGRMYAYGQGGSRDYQEAVRWYRLAADQGEAAAQYNLGYMYYLGQGVPRNYVRAYMWASLAAAQGDVDAAKGLETLEKEMTPAEIAEAQRLAREWKVKAK